MDTKEIRGLILDMDGVLWKDTEPLGDLAAIFRNIKQKNLDYVFATNNSTRTIDQYEYKFSSLGVPTKPEQILTSAVATAKYLSVNYPKETMIYAIGEQGLVTALQNEGFQIQAEGAAVVVVGLDRSADYEKIRTATTLVRRGAAFIGTNPDRTLPTPNGLAPGAGSLIAAIEAATDVKADIIGKPKAAMFELAVEVMGIEASQALVVGDRLETDIAGGQAAGCWTAVVMTGVSTNEMVAAWSPPPDMQADDLASLVAQL